MNLFPDGAAMRQKVSGPRIVSASLLLLVALLWICFAIAPHPAQSAIYTWRDAQGALHITDTPPVGSNKNTRAGGRQQKTNSLFLWTLRSPSTSGYLLGTIHFGSPKMYPLDPRIEDAFKDAAVVAMEANPRDLGPEVAVLVQQLGVYPEGDSLTQHISQKTADMLRNQGLNLELFGKMRPWMLAMQLETTKYTKLGYNSNHGVDLHFLNRLGSRRLVELESVESQIRMLSQLPEGDEDAYLQKAVTDLDKIEEFFPMLVDLWSTGDAKGLEKLALDSSSELGMNTRTYNLMIRDRNKVMAAGIAKLLKGKKPFFAMVGALHLVGPDGVPTLLAKQGFTVKQVGGDRGARLFIPYRPTAPTGTVSKAAVLYDPWPSSRWAVR